MKKKLLKHFTCALVVLIGLIGCDMVRDIDSAIKNGDLKTVKTLLKNDPNLVSNKDTNGWTPLHWSVWSENKNVAEVLLAKGADVNAKDTGNFTPLHYAAFIRDEDMVALLLANKADVNVKDDNGDTPLHRAVIMRDKDVVELLLDHNADVNTKEFYDGSTPLHEAACNGDDKDIAELLLAHGADVNARDTNGMTALYDAVRLNNKDVAELLLTNNAYVNAKNNKGETPLRLAVLLEQKGIQPGMGSRAAAMLQEQKDVADLLRQHGGQE